MPERRVALVTGANRGIGRETCLQLARLGFRVVLAARDEDKAGRAARELAGPGLEIEPLALEMDEAASIRAAAERLERAPGRLDVLVNNAGVFLDRRASGADVSAEVVRRTFETNLLGPLQLTQAVLPLMRRQGYGRIVNLSSSLGSLAEMGGLYPAYRMSKTALVALTRILAAELAGTNVLVNACCPGWVKTEMGGPRATRPVEEAPDTIVWLATLPDGGPTGGFFRDREPLAF
ncbi:MAG: SDR family oxidoreductase [Vicinamibacteria bacterium]